MESVNKLTMCRLCLCKNECLVNIFKLNDWQGYVAAEIISELLQFQVSETDGYPHVVCSTCLLKLSDFKMFKECCQKSKVVYDHMFVSGESLAKHQPEMVDLATIKKEPEGDSDNEVNVSKAVDSDGNDMYLCEEDPFRRESPDAIIKQEKLDIDSTSGVGSEETFDGTNTEMSFGPIILKHEVLPFSSGSHPQETIIKSESIGNMIEAAATSVEDSTQEDNGRRVKIPKRFECNHCKKVLKTRHGLIGHLASHGFGKYLCSLCSKTFGTNSALGEHLKKHEKPHKCIECSARFACAGSLSEHVATHSASKPYCCAICNFHFSQRSYLTSHMKKHSDLKPYQCEVCRANFRMKSALICHFRTHSGIRPYKCGICSKGFTQRGALKRHAIVHTGNRTPRCSHCNKQFKKVENLQKHLTTVCVGK